MRGSIASHFKHLDWVLVGASMLLTLFGVYALYSLAVGGGASMSLFWKQAGYSVGGLFMALAISFINPRVLKKHGGALLVLYGIIALQLAGLLLFGKFIRGTRAWYRIGEFGIAPVEFAKVVFIALLAKFFSDRHADLYTVRHVLVSLGYLAGMMLLVLAQPDLGSALVLLCLWLGITIFAGIRRRWIIAMAAVGLIAFVLAWHYGLAAYQKNRIRAFINPVEQSQSFGYNTIQAQIAVGSGGLWGKGVGGGTQGARRFLPEATTDFILAFILEERGLLAALVLFICFGCIWYRSFRIGIACGHNFGLLFAFGFALLTAIHFFMNAGMNVGLLPVIGIPLPFVSYGGSHIIASFMGMGVLLALGSQRTRA